MSMLSYIDTIKSYQKETLKYHYLQRKAAQYDELPFYKKWFTEKPRVPSMPVFYGISEYHCHKIGNSLYSIRADIRALNGIFFIAVAEETPDGIQGCRINLDSSMEPMIGGTYACTVEAKHFALKLINDLKLIISSSICEELYD